MIIEVCLLACTLSFSIYAKVTRYRKNKAEQLAQQASGTNLARL